MRIKRGVTKRRRHKKILKRASGFYAARGALVRPARLAVEKSLVYAYRDRRQRKRQFHRLWIARINAAAREHGLSYSRFIAGLKRRGRRDGPQDPRGARGRGADGVLGAGRSSRSPPPEAAP